MRNMILLAVLLFSGAVRADVNSADDKLVRTYMQEVLKFSLQPLTQARIEQQIQSFQQHVEIGIDESGAHKFKESNRWESASEKSKTQYRNVMSFFVSQIFVNKFRELLLKVANKELAEKIRKDAEAGASMKITKAADEKREILHVVLFPDIVPVAYHSMVSIDLQVENGKIVDVILGDLRTSEKSGVTEATLRRTVVNGILRSNTSQFITYNADIEREIKNSNTDAVAAYTRHFTKRYQSTLEAYHGAKGLNLDFLLQ